MKPILLIGQGNAGKTSLIRSLTGQQYIRNSELTPNVTLTEDKKEGLVYIDTGGQAEHFIPSINPFRQINPLFIVANSIDSEQILIGEARSQWLDTKSLLDPTNRSQTIIVHTHCNRSGGYTPPGKSEENLNGIEVFNVDNKSGDGIKELKSEINELTKTLPEQDITEKDFYFCNIAMDIIKELRGESGSKEELIQINKVTLMEILSRLKIQEDINTVTDELEKLDLIIKRDEKIIFPLVQNYHLYQTSKKELFNAMKVKSFSAKYLIHFLAIAFKDYVTDLDPSVICLSSNPEKDPTEVIIKMDNDFRSLIISGKKDSPFLLKIQKEVIAFLKTNNIYEATSIHLSCPCEKCAGSKNPSWVDFKFLVKHSGASCEKTYNYVETSQFESLKEMSS